jgi:hypothetical protein
MNVSSIDKFLSFIPIVYSYGLVIAFVIDTACLIKAKKLNLLGSDAYASFHMRYGLLKISFLKLCAALFLIFEFFEPSGKSGAMLMIITAYILTVIRFVRVCWKASQVGSSHIMED